MTIQARASDDLTTSDQASPVRRPMPRVRRTGELVAPIGWIALAAFVLRLPFLGGPVSPDEGGFLEVARHWHPGGGSLYGPYWVDRPPLLIALFRLADVFGGLTALRVIGAVAVAVSVLAIGWTLTRVAGRRAGTWAALMATALLVAPAGGGMIINGELLAAPFVAIGVALAVRACDEDRRAGLAAVGAGVFAVAAIMIKQNMFDVVVFAIALGIGSVVARRATWGLLGRRAAMAVLGAVVTLAGIIGLAWLAGTRPGGLYEAMYPFRLQVAALMQHEPSQDHLSRAVGMVGYWLATGAPLVIAAFVALCLTWALRRGRSASVVPPGPLVFVLAVVVLAAYDVVSIAAGGSYWLHYVLQLAFPTAAMAGLLATRLPRVGRGVVAIALVLSTVSWLIGLVGTTYAPGPVVGRAIAKVDRPGDTIASLLGDGSIVYASGLTAPYTYLWSLPARVRDPGYHQLERLLAGRRAPTWLAVRGPSTVAELQRSVVGPVLASRYHFVARICQRRVYLRNDVSRPTPVRGGSCYLPFVGFNQKYSRHIDINFFEGSSS